MILRKVYAFVRKDFIIESNYKVAFFISLINSFFSVISFYFVGKLMNGSGSSSLMKYGSSYFDFALVGVVFSNYFITAVTVFSSVIRRAQMSGCLEAVLSSQTDPKSIVFFSSFYSFASAGIQLLVAIIVAIIAFHFNVSGINFTSTLIVMFLSLIVFISIGIISAAGIIIFKQGEPFGWLLGTAGSLLGGAYFPTKVMPEWLQFLSQLIPISHTLEALRLSILRGYDLSMLTQHIIILFGYAIVLLPFSLSLFKWSVEKGKRDGSLMLY